MADLGDILSAFEDNLILARELGARTIECDRSLLSPLPPLPAAAVAPPPAVEAPPPPVAITPAERPSASAAPHPAAEASPATASPAGAHGAAASPLVLLTGKKVEKGSEVAELFGKMVLATGLARSELAFIETPVSFSQETAETIARRAAELKPKVLILFGSEAMKMFALVGCTARRGVWGAFRGIPAVATLHPEHMLRMWGHDEQALRKGKLEVWRVLKEALARIGRPHHSRQS